ncbi:protein translocase subunit SecF [Aestuariicella hydrocarbonica]|uniref:Protein-export membrane protein SecF n=1 Tax=Pseudomaricurvus hydrocarbonicus TaxID=1470433 RepID=A0A9E5T1B6_9GAMM|nr:protein translocase subunit SecF [Aestuariicella hydrocarbonica]NHO67170.1 protein translocase subunit SecF [Aestuariicella hydrocarbonica]
MAKEKKVINFMGRRKLAAAFSVILLIASVASLAINGLQFGLDFTGGTQIEVGYKQPANLNEVREQLSAAGFEGATVVFFGAETDVLIRLQRGFEPGLGDEILTALNRGAESDIELRRVEFVGPQVGEELRDEGGLGMLFALAVVMLYVAMRFQFKFSIGAVGALIHDVIIVLGFFSLLHIDFDLTVLAAVLAVIGYSLNDTIVVFDRIRENFRKLRGVTSLEVVNTSLSQTLDRTLITSGTTMLVLLALFYYGGEMIHGFATALLVGIVVGTYSSIYVASNILLSMDISKEDLMPPVKEGEEFEDVP